MKYVHCYYNYNMIFYFRKLKESLKITDDILDNIDAEKLENLWDVETKLNDILKKDKIGDKSEIE